MDPSQIEDPIILDVGGTTFSISKETILKHPSKKKKVWSNVSPSQKKKNLG